MCVLVFNSMTSMTGKILTLTGVVFTIGAVVGVLFHRSGTTSPAAYNSGPARERYGSTRVVRPWRERLSPAGDGLATGIRRPYSSNTDRDREGANLTKHSRIAGTAPEPERISHSWKSNVNTDHNEKGFIRDRNNPRSNRSVSQASAIKSSDQQLRKEASLINSTGATAVESGPSSRRQNEMVRGKIRSALKGIARMQLERESLLNDIVRTQSESALDLGQVRYTASPVSRKEVVKGFGRLYDSNERQTFDEQASTTSGATSKVTPTKNKAGGSDLDGLSSDPLLSDPRSDTNGRPSLRVSKDKPVDIFTGVFWSAGMESRCPQGFAGEMYPRWRERVANASVVRVDEGCGRLQNRRLTFGDSSRACARYRPNTDQIQGEIYSFFLSRLLHIGHVPPSVLITVNSADKVWVNVLGELAMAQWGHDKPVVLTQWIDGLEPAYIPSEFKGEQKRVHPDDVQLLNKSVSELCELMQWSDLIVFDYLTANLDRVVNNMFNQQWNSQMMSYPAHNLHKARNNNNLVFLDNESGLFHGYRLLDKYSKYHREMLSGLCVFRQRTVHEIERIFLNDSLEAELALLVDVQNSQAKDLPPIPSKNIQILKQRFRDVYEQVQKCQRLSKR